MVQASVVNCQVCNLRHRPLGPTERLFSIVLADPTAVLKGEASPTDRDVQILLDHFIHQACLHRGRFHLRWKEPDRERVVTLVQGLAANLTQRNTAQSLVDAMTDSGLFHPSRVVDVTAEPL